VKAAVELGVAAGSGAQSDYLQKHPSEEQANQNQHQRTNVPVMYNSVVKALFWHSHRLNSLALTASSVAFKDPGAQLLRRQGQEVPERVRVECDERAHDNQQDLQRECVPVEPIGEGVKHAFGHYTAQAGPSA
jgi:hypothetical protein